MDELKTQYGYKIVRPECHVVIIPPEPETIAEAALRYGRNACIAVLLIAALAAASLAPERFATGFIIGFTASRIIAR